MTIEFHCPHCDKLLKTADDKAGVQASCPGCGEALIVPAGAVSRPRSDESFPVAASGGADDSPPPLPASESPNVPPAGDEPMRDCPMCGERIKAAATRCRYCGEDLTIAAPFRHDGKPHRGGLILAFGLIGFLVCPPFGIVAWVMGNNDLREMKAGRMDPTGEGLTQAGKIIGIISCCLALLAVVFYMVAIAVAILTGFK